MLELGLTGCILGTSPRPLTVVGFNFSEPDIILLFFDVYFQAFDLYIQVNDKLPRFPHVSFLSDILIC